MHITKWRRFIVAGMLSIALPAAALAQTGAASFTGLVSDESGAAIPGATITATNQRTGVTYEAISNPAGNYVINAVLIGTYVVKAELVGFKTVATSPITVEAKQVARLDFKLLVGAIEEVVEVSGASPILQSETATVGEVLSGSTVETMPLNGRNTAQLPLLLPGAVTYNPRGFTNIGAVNSNRPFVNGNREQTNNFMVDGLDVNETIDNRVAYQPSPDALAEISVETNNYNAETGNVGGAVVASVIKSGTNEYHGNVFEFYRNSQFDENTWENVRSGARKQERVQHIAGATFGGPIVRQKLFFFADYQMSRQDAPGPGTASVAPEAWRRGDLSSIATPIIDPLTGQPFPGNQIPLARISPIARALLDPARYPLPNANVTGVTGNYVGNTLFEIRAHQGDARVDWSISGKDKAFVRYSFARYRDAREKTPFPWLLGSRNEQPFWNIGANWNRIFTSSLMNELLVGFSHTRVTAATYDWSGVGKANAAVGIGGGQPVDGLSSIGWGSGLSSPGSVAGDSDTLAKTFQINEKITWLRGRHSIKAGGQWLHYDQQRFYAGNNGLLGFINYSGAFTGYPFSDFLLDLASGKGRGGGDPNAPWTHLQDRISLFVQDDLKLTPAITLNLGLRWAYTSPLVEKDNRQTNFDLKTGVQTFAKDGSIANRALYNPYYKGFEPRVGIAWKMSDRLVVRGGYGISQFMEGAGANLRLPMNPPFFFESAVSYDRTTGAGTAATGFTGLVDGTKPSGNVRAFDPNLRPQFTQQWNVFTEYQLTSSMSAQVGYVGHHGEHLIAPVEGNQALPGVGDPSTWTSKTVRRPLYAVLPSVTTIATTASVASSRYHSMQASVRQRMQHGFEFLASYTLSSTRTNNRGFYGVSGGTGSQGVTSATEGAYWMNTYAPENEWGPAFFDARHNVVVSGAWEVPYGKGRRWGNEASEVVDALLGGWRLGGIMQMRSGLPITIFDGRNRSLQGERGAERPNCVGNPVPSNQSIDNWLDINAFQMVPLGTFGNCSVGSARAPGYRNVDLLLSKRFALGGAKAAEVRVEAFNVFNITSYGPPARDISVPNTFGKITTAVSAPRVVELVFKFFF